MKIIVTGFGPFGDNKTNPTKEILALLPKSIKGHKIVPLEVPVVFDLCFKTLEPLIEKEQPSIIINLGLASGRTAITPERIALNINDARIADNDGNAPVDQPIIPGAPLAYHSTLPLRKIESILTRKHLPVRISNTAGLYVCNNLMYHTLHYIKTNNLNIKAGFIHVPQSTEQKTDDKQFHMPLYDILEAIIDSIKTML